MDPLSIAASVTALATLCGQVVVLCNNIASRNHSIRRTLIALRTETVAYQAALHQIQDLLLDQSGSLAKLLGSDDEWKGSFNTALSFCRITMSILISELQKAIEASTGSSLRYTLKEQDIKDLIGELRGQQGGVQLLLQTLQLKSTADVLQLLRAKQDVLRKVKDQTDTLSDAWGVRNVTSDGQGIDTFSIIKLDLEDKTFDFDDEISRMGPYRRALRAQLQAHEQRQTPIANLIDDDLLDLSIAPTISGPWVALLEEEYGTAATIQPQESENSHSIAQLPLDDDMVGTDPEITSGRESANESKLLPITSVVAMHNESEEALQGIGSDTAVLALVPPSSAEPVEPQDPISIGQSATQSETEVQDSESIRSASSENALSIGAIASAELASTAEFPSMDESGRHREANVQDLKPFEPNLAKHTVAGSPWDFEVRNGHLEPPKLQPEQLEKIRQDPLDYAAFSGNLPDITSLLLPKKYKEIPEFKLQRPLFYAAMNGKTEVLKLLLKKGASVSVDSTGMNALHWAAVHGHRDAIRLLAKERQAMSQNCTIRCSFNGKIVKIRGWTGLSLAVYFGHAEIVKDLIKTAKNSIEMAYTTSGFLVPPLIPPLHVAVATLPYLLLYSYFGGGTVMNITAPRELLHIPDLDRLRTQHAELWLSHSELSTATADVDRMIKMIDLLSGLKISLNSRDSVGFTALHVASCGISSSVMQRLIELGCTPSSEKHRGSALDRIFGRVPFNGHPLCLAAFWNRPNVAELLLGDGPDPEGPNSPYQTPLQYASAMGNIEVTRTLVSSRAATHGLKFERTHHNETSLSLAMKWQRWEVMAYLIKSGADLTSPLYTKMYNDKDEIVYMGRCETILHLAASQKSGTQAMQLLMRNGASANIRNKKGETPLHTVAQNPENRLEAMQCLIDHGADPNAMDSDGNTPLHAVIRAGAKVVPAVKLLLKANADPCMKDNVGRTPLNLARKCIVPEKSKKKRESQLRWYHVDDYKSTILLLQEAIKETATTANSH